MCRAFAFPEFNKSRHQFYHIPASMKMVSGAASIPTAVRCAVIGKASPQSRAGRHGTPKNAEPGRFGVKIAQQLTRFRYSPYSARDSIRLVLMFFILHIPPKIRWLVVSQQKIRLVYSPYRDRVLIRLVLTVFFKIYILQN